ncbi:ankyrin repeat-containing domain protein [Nemania abortiva]|nr:ankyrin repeat-containing domain protein [Nemania abortiva]
MADLCDVPATPRELLCAISLPHVSHNSDFDIKVLTEDDMHWICGDFIVYDGATVSIAHPTAVDFIERNYSKDIKMLIAKECISYLSNPNLRTALSQSHLGCHALRLEKHPLFSYAAIHWSEHLVIATAEGGDLNSLVMDMLSHEEVVTSIYNALSPSKQEKGVTGLHLAALLGLGDIIDSLVNRATKSKGPIRGTHSEDNPEIIKKVLCCGINPNIKNTDGQTALHLAIILNKKAAALELATFRKGNGFSGSLSLYIPDKQGYTPVISARKQGMLEVVEALERSGAGAHVNVAVEDLPPVPEIEVGNNHGEIAGELLRSPVETRPEGLSILHRAAEHGHQEIIKQLYMKGEDMNLQTSEGTPILCAIRHGQKMAVWLLLGYGASLHIPGPDGNTALFTAVENNEESIIWLLLEYGANPNVCNNEGETPLHRAVLDGKVSAAWLLLHKGAKTDLRNKKGEMPIHIATSRDDASVLNVLLQYAHDVEALDGVGCTPMHIAAREGALSTANCLIRAGANVNATCSSGTPLHVAADEGKNSADFIQLLITMCEGWQELDLNSGDRWKRTPLHAAVNSDNEQAVRALLAGGANPNLINGKGLTPRHEATIKKRVPIVKALLEYDASIKKAIFRVCEGEEGGEAMLATLLRAGVNVNTQSKLDGCTPVHLAAYLGSTEAIEMMCRIAIPPPDLAIEDNEKRTAVQVGREQNPNVVWSWETWVAEGQASR